MIEIVRAAAFADEANDRRHAEQHRQAEHREDRGREVRVGLEHDALSLGSADGFMRQHERCAMPAYAIGAQSVFVGLAGILVCAAIVTALLWNWFVRLHTRLQVALLETMETPASPG